MLGLLNFQNKLKSSQKDKVKKFMTFTQASENVAIFCLAKNDWKLEQASDNFFQNPLEYDSVKINSQLNYSVDKRKLEIMYARYRGKVAFLYILLLRHFSTSTNFMFSVYCYL